ncbi:MAG TPA: hypothetical protein VJX10_00435, partial [Pseudonocardiaceae bacterium]|nr:hypothetical protein [Pseudonocardiaceae bacterium]
MTAVVLNVTAVTPTDSSFLTVFPWSARLLGVSNLNFTKGQAIPNAVMTPVGGNFVDFFNHIGSVHAVVDPPTEALPGWLAGYGWPVTAVAGVRWRFGPAALMGGGLLVLGIAGYGFVALAGRTLPTADAVAVSSLYLLINIIGPGVFVALEQET